MNDIINTVQPTDDKGNLTGNLDKQLDKRTQYLYDLLSLDISDRGPLSSIRFDDMLSKFPDLTYTNNEIVREIKDYLDKKGPIKQFRLDNIKKSFLDSLSQRKRRKNILCRILVSDFEHLFPMDDDDKEVIGKDKYLDRGIIKPYYEFVVGLIGKEHKKLNEEVEGVFNLLLNNGKIEEFNWKLLYDNDMVKRIKFGMLLKLAKEFIKNIDKSNKNYYENKMKIVGSINGCHKDFSDCFWKFTEFRFCIMMYFLYKDKFLIADMSYDKKQEEFIKHGLEATNQNIDLFVEFMRQLKFDMDEIAKGTRNNKALFGEGK